MLGFKDYLQKLAVIAAKKMGDPDAGDDLARIQKKEAEKRMKVMGLKGRRDWYHMTKDKKIIFLTDLIETKVRKEKELEYYQAELQKLQEKMFYVKKEIDLTKTIINIIEDEKVIDVRENLYKSITDET